MISSINKKKFYSYQNKNDEPVTSYGLIVFFKDIESDCVYFLLQQRRDTFEYMDFIRGIWRTETQLSSLFALMCEEERVRIRNYTFRELWDDLFVDKNSKMYKDSYIKSKKKYDMVRHLIPNILDTTQTHVVEPPWGFPKGKKNSYHESEVDCAIRETEEETKISANSMTIIGNYKYSEQFSGTNCKTYATHYYLAEASEKFNPQKIEIPGCIRKYTMSEEARDVKWLTYTESSKFLNPRRYQLLHDALQHIKLL